MGCGKNAANISQFVAEIRKQCLRVAGYVYKEIGCDSGSGDPVLDAFGAPWFHRSALTATIHGWRGRDASYLAPPAQTRTRSFPAYGSHLGYLTENR